MNNRNVLELTPFEMLVLETSLRINTDMIASRMEDEVEKKTVETLDDLLDRITDWREGGLESAVIYIIDEPA